MRTQWLPISLLSLSAVFLLLGVVFLLAAADLYGGMECYPTEPPCYGPNEEAELMQSLGAGTLVIGSINLTLMTVVWAITQRRLTAAPA